MTCLHCQHAMGCATPPGRYVLWCTKHKRIADAPCQDFQREPGSDDE